LGEGGGEREREGESKRETRHRASKGWWVRRRSRKEATTCERRMDGRKGGRNDGRKEGRKDERKEKRD
jgi:hypothetical protein